MEPSMTPAIPTALLYPLQSRVMDHRILQHQPQIRELCRRFSVSRLEIFGSAAAPERDEEPNDFDFLVDFKPSRELKALDAYFGLKESLEDLLGLPVDVVMPSALNNPYFRAQVERQKQPIYEALIREPIFGMPSRRSTPSGSSRAARAWWTTSQIRCSARQWSDNSNRRGPKSAG